MYFGWRPRPVFPTVHRRVIYDHKYCGTHVSVGVVQNNPTHIYMYNTYTYIYMKNYMYTHTHIYLYITYYLLLKYTKFIITPAQLYAVLLK